jgi:hypothetical protein
MQQHTAVPPALVQATYNFENSAMRQRWRRHHVASPGSICEISFRIINLYAAFINGEVTDPQVIRETALEIDSDLQTWKAGVSPSWGYTIIDAPEAAASTCFNGKSHVYPNLWIGEVWNNWRALRIWINQIIVRNEVLSSVPGDVQKSTALSVIRQLSTDLCISTSSFMGTPRKFPSLHKCGYTTYILRRYSLSHTTTIFHISRGVELLQRAFLCSRAIAPY